MHYTINRQGEAEIYIESMMINGKDINVTAIIEPIVVNQDEYGMDLDYEVVKILECQEYDEVENECHDCQIANIEAEIINYILKTLDGKTYSQFHDDIVDVLESNYQEWLADERAGI